MDDLAAIHDGDASILVDLEKVGRDQLVEQVEDAWRREAPQATR
ncbi:MAG: hypothetical protein JWP64_4267 [Pseudonocardia sp.]|jgi:hypothetical protein|nr:hypothetical protein [Pseudonocardia sp.]MCU1629318.1 hypothetical protein [Pseudonocardia sp.]